MLHSCGFCSQNTWVVSFHPLLILCCDPSLSAQPLSCSRFQQYLGLETPAESLHWITVLSVVLVPDGRTWNFFFFVPNLLAAWSGGSLYLFLFSFFGWVDPVGCFFGITFLLGQVKQKCVFPELRACADYHWHAPTLPWGFATVLKMAPSVALFGRLGCELHPAPTPIHKGSAALFDSISPGLAVHGLIQLCFQRPPIPSFLLVEFRCCCAVSAAFLPPRVPRCHLRHQLSTPLPRITACLLLHCSLSILTCPHPVPPSCFPWCSQFSHPAPGWKSEQSTPLMFFLTCSFSLPANHISLVLPILPYFDCLIFTRNLCESSQECLLRADTCFWMSKLWVQCCMYSFPSSWHLLPFYFIDKMKTRFLLFLLMKIIVKLIFKKGFVYFLKGRVWERDFPSVGFLFKWPALAWLKEEPEPYLGLPCETEWESQSGREKKRSSGHWFPLQLPHNS